MRPRRIQQVILCKTVLRVPARVKAVVNQNKQLDSFEQALACNQVHGDQFNSVLHNDVGKEQNTQETFSFTRIQVACNLLQ